MSEPDFFNQIVKRNFCGQLLDVNNVFISATNLDFDPRGSVDQLELFYVGEIHLGDHDQDSDDAGAPLLINSHGREIADPVWALLDYVLEKRRRATSPF